MSTALLVTGGYGNGTFSGSVGSVVLNGYMEEQASVNAFFTISAQPGGGSMGCDVGYFEMCAGEVYNHSYNTAAKVEWLGSALSSGAWTLDQGTSVTLGSQSVSGSEVIATLTAASVGRSVLSCLATYADGQKSKAKLTVYVR